MDVVLVVVGLVVDGVVVEAMVSTVVPFVVLGCCTVNVAFAKKPSLCFTISIEVRKGDNSLCLSFPNLPLTNLLLWSIVGSTLGAFGTE